MMGNSFIALFSSLASKSSMNFHNLRLPVQGVPGLSSCTVVAKAQQNTLIRIRSKGKLGQFDKTFTSVAFLFRLQNNGLTLVNYTRKSFIDPCLINLELP